MPVKRTLLLIHRGPEYQDDFDDIARRVAALDRDITVYHLPWDLKAALPEAAWQSPALTVSLVARFRVPVKRGPVLRNRPLEKLKQQEIFRRNGIPTPPAMPFQFGMKLDPVLFGEFVMLKPMELDLSSTAEGLQMYRRRRLQAITPNDLPPDHPLRAHPRGFMVQRFIDTGDFPSQFRITTFLGAALTSERFESTLECPPLTSDDSALERAAFHTKAARRYRVTHEAEVTALAVRTAACFPDFPLLGVDVIRNAQGRLFVLEVNAGGNTWHYSSQMYATHRWQNPEYYRAMKSQFGAFDVAARRLVEEVHRQAA